jgi:hypothetical protein
MSASGLYGGYTTSPYGEDSDREQGYGYGGSASLDKAREDAYAIFDTINGTAGWQIHALASAGTVYEAQVIEALAAPQYIGQDEKMAHEFSVNYMLKMKKV